MPSTRAGEHVPEPQDGPLPDAIGPQRPDSHGQPAAPDVIPFETTTTWWATDEGMDRLSHRATRLMRHIHHNEEWLKLEYICQEICYQPVAYIQAPSEADVLNMFNNYTTRYLRLPAHRTIYFRLNPDAPHARQDDRQARMRSARHH